MLGTKKEPLSVGALSKFIKNNLNDMGGGYFEGEVSHCSLKGGKAFLDIKDDDFSVSANIWNTASLSVLPEEGKIFLFFFNKIDIWKNGKVSVNITKVELSREGVLEKQKEELIKEIIDNKFNELNKLIPLPELPQGIGLITGNQAMALNDVLTSIKQRFSLTKIYSLPALVQGDRAPIDIINSIKQLENIPEVEVIILARGGGSKDDLAAFDNRDLCLTIAHSTKPIITAVGHTDDNQVANLVAHSFVHTPSKIGELLFPTSRDDYDEQIKNNLSYAADILLKEIEYQKAWLEIDGLISIIQNKKDHDNEQILALTKDLQFLIDSHYHDSFNDAKSLAKEFEQLKKTAVTVRKNNKIVISVNELEIGDELEIIFSDGTISSQIKGIIKK